MAKYAIRDIMCFLALIPFTGKQLLVHEETAQMASNAIAVATTLVLPRILILFQLCLPFVLYLGRRMIQPIRGRVEEESGRLTSHALETFRSADSLGTAASRLMRQHFGKQHIALGAKDHNLRTRCRQLWLNLKADKWGFSVICLAILALGAFYIGIQATAILTARMVSTSHGISTSPDCGLWVPGDPTSLKDTNIGPSFGAVLTQRLYEDVFEAEAQYGEAVTRTPGSDYAVSKVEYREYKNEPCPFANECCAGERSAFTLDTGVQNARILGINTAEAYSFRKSISCAPLIRQSSNESLATEAYPDLESIEKHYKARPGDSYSSMQVLGETSCYGTRYPIGYVTIIDHEAK